MSDCREIHGMEEVKERAEKLSLENLPELEEKLEAFAEAVGSGKVLDAGCGFGRDVNFFVNCGLGAKGIDTSKNMIKYAKQNMRGEFECNSIEGMDPEPFKGIWCNTVMQFFHPEKVPSILAKFNKMLEKGGVLYLTFRLYVPGEHDSRSYTRKGEDIKRYRLTPEEAEKTLEQAGFNILEAEEAETNDPILVFFCKKN